MIPRSLRLFGTLASVGLLALAAAPVATATGTVVNDCSNDSQLSNAIAAGHSPITFNCGVATIVLSDAEVVTNSVTIDGGDKITLSGANSHELFETGLGSSLDLKHIVLKKGHDGSDGGAINSAGFLALENATIMSSSETANGGAIYSTGTVDITSSVLSGNSALHGGALYLSGSGVTDTISNSVISGNDPGTTTSGQEGGGIYVDTGTTLFVHSSYIHNNQVGPGGEGGALFNNGTSTVDGSTLASNTTGGSGDGGGIYNQSSLTLTNDTLTRNTGRAFGGGLFNRSGSATLTNVTIAGNSEITDNGGGVLNYTGATMKLTNVLLSHNSNDNCRFITAPSTSVGNVSTDGTCGFGSGRDNAAVALGPLETNGGQTLTERLLPGSAGINFGTASGAPGIDQRGVTRPQPSAGFYDAGAVEFVPCSGIPTTRPTLLGPTSGAKVKTTQPVLDWYGPDCATKFQVVVRRGSTTGTIVVNKTVFPASQLKSPTLARGHTYFWLVKGCDPSGCISSNQWSFNVP